VDPATLARTADQLLASYTSREAIDPLVAQFPDLQLEDSYEIQLLQIRARLAAGATIKGHKVGLTSKAMQRQLGVNQPDYGHLLDDMFFLENSPIPMSGFIQPRVEPEVAFVLRKPLKGPGVTVAEAISAVDYVLPALEIVDSRIKNWKIGILDTIADNASSGAVVLGSRPTPLEAVDLRMTGCVLTKNARIVDTGAGGAVLGSPINSLVWLANTVGARGVTLEPGHIVLPGSCTSMVPVVGGDSVTATFAGLGSVTAIFAKES
jgi:2-keto-4-pentenoate hydratase